MTRNLLQLVFALTFATAVFADGPVVQTTPLTRQLLRAPDAGTARSVLGLSSTNASATNQFLETPTVDKPTSTGGTFNNAAIGWSTVSNSFIFNPTNTGGSFTGGNFSNPTNTGGNFTGGNFTGGYFGGVQSFQQTNSGNANSFGGPLSAANTNNSVYATALPYLGQNLYFLSGFRDFTNNIGSMILAVSTDGKNFNWLNGGNSVWNGIGGLSSVNGFVPDLMIYSNVAYVLYSQNGNGGTNVYLGASTNLIQWTCIYVFTDTEVSANVSYASRLMLGTNGLPVAIFTSSTDGGSHYDPYISYATDGSMTNWTSATRIMGVGGDVRSSHDANDFMPVLTSGGWVAMVSSMGHYGMVFTNNTANLGTNWSYWGQITNSSGNLLWGEGFNALLQPDGSFRIYYDDNPNNAVNGHARYIQSSSPLNVTLSSVSGSPVYDDNLPFCTGRAGPIRHPEVTICSNVPPAMIPALISGKSDPGLIWNNHQQSSPGFYIKSAADGTLSMSSVSAVVNNNDPLNAGLILDCSFNEGAGTNINDSSGNGLTGFILGAQPYNWQPGFIGNALSMTNNAPQGNQPISYLTNVVVMPVPWQCSSLTNFSVEVRYIQTNFPSGSTPILFDLAAQGTSIAFYVQMYPNGFGAYLQNPSGAQTLNSGPTSTNAWHDLVYTFNNSLLTQYFDGLSNAALAEAGPVTNIVGDNNANIYIGGMLSGGAVGAVRMWDRCLNTNEVRILARQFFVP